MRKGLLQNEKLYKLFVIPSKTATHWVAVLRGNPSSATKNGLPRQCTHWLAMAVLWQKNNFETGLFAILKFIEKR